MYEQKLNGLQKFLPSAIDRLFAEFSEAALSWDLESVVGAIVAHARLTAESLPDVTADNAYSIAEAALAALIQSGKVVPKSYGFSPIGAEQVNLLLAKYATPARVEASPEAEFGDVVAIYNGPVHEFNRQMKIASFRTRFDAAVSAGII